MFVCAASGCVGSIGGLLELGIGVLFSGSGDNGDLDLSIGRQGQRGIRDSPPAERRSLAERWLVRAQELGYERLELMDPTGRTLGRPARVGSGMILLDSLSNPP